MALSFRVQEADILVHIEDVAVAQTLDIFGNIHNLLQVLVVAIVENGVIDDNTIHVVVAVRGQDGFFDVVAGDIAEGIRESTSTRPTS